MNASVAGVDTASGIVCANAPLGRATATSPEQTANNDGAPISPLVGARKSRGPQEQL